MKLLDNTITNAQNNAGETRMKLKGEVLTNDVQYIDFKDFEIRLEISKEHTNDKLKIIVRKTMEDEIIGDFLVDN